MVKSNCSTHGQVTRPKRWIDASHGCRKMKNYRSLFNSMSPFSRRKVSGGEFTVNDHVYFPLIRLVTHTAQHAIKLRKSVGHQVYFSYVLGGWRPRRGPGPPSD